jgi:hypothetical protein
MWKRERDMEATILPKESFGFLIKLRSLNIEKSTLST